MRNQLTLVFLVAGALLTMGAKLSEVQIEDFSNVARSWKGFLVWEGSWRYPINIVIEKGGLYQEKTSECESKGAMHVDDGKMRYVSCIYDMAVVVTLHEVKGKRVLKGVADSRMFIWELKPAKKNGKKKKKADKKEY